MGVYAPPVSVVTAKSWKEAETIVANRFAFNSLIKCNVAMLATNPMPGKPSIKIGSLSFGFSVISTAHTMWFKLPLHPSE
jgi:hypothetical protein